MADEGEGKTSREKRWHHMGLSKESKNITAVARERKVLDELKEKLLQLKLNDPDHEGKVSQYIKKIESHENGSLKNKESKGATVWTDADHKKHREDSHNLIQEINQFLAPFKKNGWSLGDKQSQLPTSPTSHTKQASEANNGKDLLKALLPNMSIKNGKRITQKDIKTALQNSYFSQKVGGSFLKVFAKQDPERKTQIDEISTAFFKIYENQETPEKSFDEQKKALVEKLEEIKGKTNSKKKGYMFNSRLNVFCDEAINKIKKQSAGHSLPK